MTGLPSSTKGQISGMEKFHLSPCHVSERVQTVVEMMYNMFSSFEEKQPAE